MSDFLAYEAHGPVLDSRDGWLVAEIPVEESPAPAVLEVLAHQASFPPRWKHVLLPAGGMVLRAEWISGAETPGVRSQEPVDWRSLVKSAGIEPLNSGAARSRRAAPDAAARFALPGCAGRAQGARMWVTLLNDDTDSAPDSAVLEARSLLMLRLQSRLRLVRAAAADGAWQIEAAFAAPPSSPAVALAARALAAAARMAAAEIAALADPSLARAYLARAGHPNKPHHHP